MDAVEGKQDEISKTTAIRLLQIGRTDYRIRFRDSGPEELLITGLSRALSRPGLAPSYFSTTALRMTEVQ